MVKLQSWEIKNLKNLAKDINKLIRDIEDNNNGVDIQVVLNDLVYLDVDASDLIDCVEEIQERINNGGK